jgi:8-oxo-dGTP pyrophosphatase MutT (NUDIX family)
VEALWSELAERLKGQPGRPFDLPWHALKPSAVLVPLVERGGVPHLAFIKRPTHLRHHRGQVAFPGGGQEPMDTTLVDTALRETEEELGVPPSLVTVLGPLDEVPTTSVYRVTPIVAGLPSSVRFVPNPEEVTEVLEVPLSVFFDPARVRKEDWEFEGQSHEVCFFDYGAHVIWGATGRIIQNLLQVTADLPAWKEYRKA